MGTVFDLIADRALQTEDPADYPDCQVCGAIAPVYCGTASWTFQFS